MKIAILGLGTVGTGIVSVIQQNRAYYQQRYRIDLDITHIFARSLDKAQGMDLSAYHITQNIEELYDADIDLVIEVIGGTTLPYELITEFIRRGKHIVTANKDLLAQHIDELEAYAIEKGVCLRYEASVGGGIPIMNAIEMGVASNQVTGIMGILNGTTNYMLDKMTNEQSSYESALCEAQAKGYAESDPTNDVDGYDAQRKIALLSRLAYGTPIALNKVKVKGIRNLTTTDMEIARQVESCIKLLGTSKVTSEGIALSVEPVILPLQHPLANVRGANNAIFVQGNAIGEAMLWGPGAGGRETASAVVSDVLSIALNTGLNTQTVYRQLPIVEDTAPFVYYVRFADEDVVIEEQLERLAIQYQWVSQSERAIMTEPLTLELIERMDARLQVIQCLKVIQ